MTEFINILKSNNLYEDDENFIVSGNKLDEFLDTYKYNGTKKHFFPKNIERDNNGSLILDKIPYIISNKKIIGDNKPFWILLSNGSKILIKDANEESIDLELLIMYFLKEVDMACAKYDKVLLNGKTYISSNCFLRNNEDIEFNLPGIGLDIEENVAEMKKYRADIFYLKTVLLDRLYGNTDRCANFGIINGNHMHGKPAPPRIAPLFDNADKCLIKENKHIQLFPGIDGDDYMDTVINYLTNYEFINLFISNKLKKVDLEKCASLIEKEKGIIVSQCEESAYKKLERYFKYSESEINKALKSSGQSFRIKLT